LKLKKNNQFVRYVVLSLLISIVITVSIILVESLLTYQRISVDVKTEYSEEIRRITEKGRGGISASELSLLEDLVQKHKQIQDERIAEAKKRLDRNEVKHSFLKFVKIFIWVLSAVLIIFCVLGRYHNKKD